MTIIFTLLIGIVIGIIFMGIGTLRLNAGNLRIDSSDEDGPYLFLELKKPVGWLKERDWVLLKVDDSSYITPK